MNYRIKTRNATHYCADVYLILPLQDRITGKEASIAIIYADGHTEQLGSVLSWQVFDSPRYITKY